MAMNQQQAGKNDEETTTQEKKIPVFTVLKNNSILKNIFLVDNRSSSSSHFSTISSSSSSQEEQREEETLVVGRHPDCNITLEHPSISRFHLRIHSNPSSRSLSVTDLSSVHGTWVSGRKIESGVQVELNDGDTLRLGGSSRMYSLHWIPLSRAYDLENPFLSPLDESDPVEESEEEGEQQTRTNTETEEESKERTQQTLTLGDNDFLEGLDSLFSDRNIISSFEDIIPSAPPVPEDVSSSFYGENDDGLEQSETSELQHCSQINKQNSISERPCASEECKNPESPPVSSVQRYARSIWSRRGKPASVHIQTASCNKKSKSPNANSDLISVVHDNNAIQSISKDLFPYLNVDEEEEEEVVFTPNKENRTPETRLARLLNMTGQEKMKNESILRPTFSTIDGSDDESFTPDKENMTPNTLLLRSMKKMGKIGEIKHFNPRRSSPLKNVVGPKTPYQDHVLSSLDSENQTRKVLQEQNYTSPTSKQVRSVLQPTAQKGKADRVPFQSLPVESTSETKMKANVPNDSTRSQKPENLRHFNPVHNGKSTKENKRWTMVVDTASLVNKDSRKALQLLQGLKGTNLIIPRIVVRELDCMNRRCSFFKRTTEVSSALQWIEDCMVNTKGWIRVQSSAEEVRLIAPTPPVTPLSCFRDESDIFSTSVVPFSPSFSMLEIVSPTAQDHVLECALFFRRITNGHLVILSDDVTLKIKAMAEGLLCETAEQFRESLANPFSERFMWTDSSPRGLTWSCIDDVVLREKYNHGPLQKLSKSGEGVKGLKLILLHNTHYRQRTISFINN